MNYRDCWSSLIPVQNLRWRLVLSEETQRLAPLKSIPEGACAGQLFEFVRPEWLVELGPSFSILISLGSQKLAQLSGGVSS